MCQSLDVVLQQNKDDRDTSWTALFSKSHQMIQEGWQSLYSMSNVAGVILDQLEFYVGQYHIQDSS